MGIGEACQGMGAGYGVSAISPSLSWSLLWKAPLNTVLGIFDPVGSVLCCGRIDNYAVTDIRQQNATRCATVLISSVAYSIVNIYLFLFWVVRIAINV